MNLEYRHNSPETSQCKPSPSNTLGRSRARAPATTTAMMEASSIRIMPRLALVDALVTALALSATLLVGTLLLLRGAAAG